MYNNDVMSHAIPDDSLAVPAPTDRRTTSASPTRQAMLDAARALFVAEGIEAISVRRVAALAGCTTMALYTHFSGKDGLLAALFDEGFAELSRAQQAVPPQREPLAYAAALCVAYRQTAHRFPHHYALMLGRFSGVYHPSPQSAAIALQTLDTLVSAIAAALTETPDRAERAMRVARQLFAFCHGWVSLEAMNFATETESSERDFLAAIDTLLKGAAERQTDPDVGCHSSNFQN